MTHYLAALAIKPDVAEAENNLGMAFARGSKLNEAIVHYQKALDLTPQYSEAENNLANALARSGRLDEALEHFRIAVQLKPNSSIERENFARAVALRDGLLKTIARRREYLRSHPNDLDMLKDTAWALATNPNASARNGAEAVELAQRAVQLSGEREPVALDTLAAAYAEAGRFDDAMATARKAIALYDGQNRSETADSAKARLRLYQSKRPARDVPGR